MPRNSARFELDASAIGEGGLVQLSIALESDQTVHLAGQNFNATVFRIHPVLGHIVSLIARLIGLHPRDVIVWVVEGEDPAVAVVIGQLGGYGPVVSSDLVGADFGK